MGRFGGGRICYHEILCRSRNLLLLVERPTLMSSRSCIGNRVDKNFHKIDLKNHFQIIHSSLTLYILLLQ
jgi:hypothetical protein